MDKLFKYNFSPLLQAMALIQLWLLTLNHVGFFSTISITILLLPVIIFLAFCIGFAVGVLTHIHMIDEQK